MDYTHDQWMTAQEWADTVEKTGADPDLTAVTAVIRSTPEPKFMLTDVPVDERDKYIGCAAKVDEVRGWLESLPDEDECCATITYYDGVLRWRDAEPYEVELLPDEPRMTIPGFTPEPRTLNTWEDFVDAPHGTLVSHSNDTFYKNNDTWQKCGITCTLRDGKANWDISIYTSSKMPHKASPATVVRWGLDK